VLIGAWPLFGLPGTPMAAAPTPVTVTTPSSAPPTVLGPGPTTAPGSGPATAPGSGPATAPGSVPVPGPSPVSVTSFGFRAAATAPQFVAVGMSLPVLSVILVAFTGGLTDRARQVVQTAIWILAIDLGLGVLSWLGTFGTHLRPGIWFVEQARFLAIAAVALIFTVAVSRSKALRPPALAVGADDEDFTEDY
jgi:hypothetical protein